MIGKKFGCVHLRWKTIDKIDHIMREDDNGVFSVSEWFELEPLSTICGVVHVVKRKYGVKPFSNASACPYHRFCVNRFNRNEKLSEYRLDSEALV